MIPLADRLRPQQLDEVVGQDHLVGAKGPLRGMLMQRKLFSLIFWGPPGTGKTTLARILAQASSAHFVELSAIDSGVAELKKIFKQARDDLSMGRQTVLFVDEIHRFNRAQQDSFLPYVEQGDIILIGATTENPSFEVNSALLSRVQVYVLKPLNSEELLSLIKRAEKELQKSLNLSDTLEALLCKLAAGDGRTLLNYIEIVSNYSEQNLTQETLLNLIQKRAANYDKSKEMHYNLISVLHKSMRSSDVDGALYWLARMLDGGEDPLYIARRLIRFASEDIGLADPQALIHSIAARDAFQTLGSPEGELALVQAVIYLSTAPKSNSVYSSFKIVRRAAADTRGFQPPKHALNAPTQLMKDQGYSVGYIYDHDTSEGCSGLNYLPKSLHGKKFYQPSSVGNEQTIMNRLANWRALRAKKAVQ